MSGVEPTHSLQRPSPTERASILSESDEKLVQLMHAKGYLILQEGKLGITDDLAKAKSSHVEVNRHLNDLDGYVNARVLQQLGLRLSDERLKASIAPMTSAALTRLLTTHLGDHGLSSTLHLLDHICETKMNKQLRFNTVEPWPQQRSTPLLHLFPNAGTASASPLPRGSPLLDVIEPSLEPTRIIAGQQISNAQLLLMDLSILKEIIKDLSEPEKEKTLKVKQDLDNYYKHKAYFPCALEGKDFLITVPTTRYATNQFLALCVPGRKDILILAEDRIKKRLEDATEISSLSKSKMISSIPSTKLREHETTSILEAVEQSISPQSILKNNSDVLSMAKLIKSLPSNSFVGQNSPDTSSDANYQHFQIFLDAPTDLVPLFTAPDEIKSEAHYVDTEGQTKSIKCARLSSDDFHGSIYRITTSGNDRISQSFLDNIQNDFLQSDNNGSSLNLIARKINDSHYEYYFVLRKSIVEHPELQIAAVSKGSTRPGWVEMCGVRLGKTESEFTSLPDELYKKEILETFSVNPKECMTFEKFSKINLARLA